MAEERRRHELEQKLAGELAMVPPCFIEGVEKMSVNEINEKIEIFKKQYNDYYLTLSDGGAQFRAGWESYERELRKRKHASSPTFPPQVPQLIYNEIFITLPPASPLGLQQDADGNLFLSLPSEI
ncbi:hypothetical protein QL285_076996 [Trifolium repens]|nr:hypothetical protein QL285_076996 [Trifolium repens]